MKKTIACLAMIAGAVSTVTANAADTKKTTTKAKSEERAPAAALTGYTFAGCLPSYQIYDGDDAYKNSCYVPLQTFKVPAGGFTPQGSTRDALGCDEKHNLIVSATPLSFRCLPPGAMEL